MVYKNIVHQIIISDSADIDVAPNSESIGEFFKGHQAILWTEKSIKYFMKKNDDDRVARAFDKIRPFAFKADLARYYLVYHFGGWYTDLNNYFLHQPPEVSDIDMVVFRDPSIGEIGTWGVQNSLFFSRARNPILQESVSICIKHIESNYYGPHPLSITGPVTFGYSMAKNYELMNQKTIIGDFHIYDYSPRGFYIKKEIFSEYKPGMDHKAISIPGGNSYDSMWYSRDIYN